MTRATGSDRAGPSAPDDRADAGRGAMPGWAARHLAEADRLGSLGSLGGAPDLTPPAPGRHRYRRGRRPDEPSRLRGWALATAAVAAAAGTVPLAVANLARQDEPLPQVETFPVVAPVDIGRGDPGPSTAGTVALAEPGPDAAGSLPPLVDPGEPSVASPRVAPTAAARPWFASPPRAEEARIPRARPPRQPDRPPSTSVTPTTTDPADAGPDPRENDGSGAVTEPRESTPTTTTTTTPPSSSRGRHSVDPDDEAPPRRPGLLGSTVREVSGLLN